MDRQRYVFSKLLRIMNTRMKFGDKDQARSFFQKLTQSCKDWNATEFQSDDFKQTEEQMNKMLAEVSDYAE